MRVYVYVSPCSYSLAPKDKNASQQSQQPPPLQRTKSPKRKTHAQNESTTNEMKETNADIGKEKKTETIQQSTTATTTTSTTTKQEEGEVDGEEEEEENKKEGRRRFFPFFACFSPFDMTVFLSVW